MKRRRTLCLLLLALALLVGIAGCSGQDNGPAREDGSTVSPTVGEKTESEAVPAVPATGSPAEQAPAGPGDPEPEGENGPCETAPENEGAGGNNACAEEASADSRLPGVDTAEGCVTLVITKDFGRETLLERRVRLEGDTSVLTLLEGNAEVTTGYGGGFITGINGLQSTSGGLSGERQDWFYYVNGIFADVGAYDYYLQCGDVVWWDYHPWTSGVAISAVIGSYPAPFVRGYQGTVKPVFIMSQETDRDLALTLQEALQVEGTAAVVERELTADLLQKREGPTIVVGEWSTLKGIAWMENLNRAYRRNGTFVHFTDSGLELLDYRGEVRRQIDESAGVILAVGEGSGDGRPLWLVAGTDKVGLEQAVEVLAKRPGKLAKLFQAAVVGGEVIPLPLP